MDFEKQKLGIYYFQVTDLWRRFCELHTNLFDLTCDEYSLLLGSEVDLLSLKIEEKEAVVDTISKLETLRTELIETINQELSDEKKIKSVSELLSFFSDFEIEQTSKHLFRFNALLIDIIEKIQTQNKKNQLFINKAIISLQSIREEAKGGKGYSTYTSKAMKAKIHTEA